MRCSTPTQQATPVSERRTLQEGLVVASHGRHCVVESADGVRRICHPRGKKSQAVVGDRVSWLSATPGQGEEGTIEKVLPRKNLFYRQDEIRTKSFAANLDQVLILVAAEPEFSAHQLSRALIAAEAEHITPIIGLNKSDLVEPFGVQGRLWASPCYWLVPLGGARAVRRPEVQAFCDWVLAQAALTRRAVGDIADPEAEVLPD